MMNNLLPINVLANSSSVANTKVLAKSLSVVRGEKMKPIFKCNNYDLNKTEEDIYRMLELGDIVPIAVENLQHWLNATGVEKEIMGSLILDKNYLIDHVKNNHYPKIELGCKSRLNSKSSRLFPDSNKTFLNGRVTIKPESNILSVSGEATLYYEDSKVAPPTDDLFYGLGGFTVFSKVKVTAEVIEVQGLNPIKWNVNIEEWSIQIYDRYNWDSGKKTPIPPPIMRVIEDEEMSCFAKKTGKGESYDIYSSEVNIVGKIGRRSFEVKKTA